jgi:hypothetical protein
MNGRVLGLVYALLFAASGCEEDPKPASRADAGSSTSSSGSSGITTGDGGTGECTQFATEHEQILNAPTDVPGQKKNVVLPP